MSAEMPRDVYVCWLDESGRMQQVFAPTRGHPDFSMSEWREAFRAQFPSLAAPLPDGGYRSVYLEFYLD